MEKFKLTKNKIKKFGIFLFQIEAVTSFTSIMKGEKGGFIEKEENLSQNGNAWVSGNAWVYGNARVSGKARVSDNARVYGNARVSGDARVSGNARVSSDARVSGNARVSGDARVSDNARVSGDASVSGNAWVSGKLEITTNMKMIIGLCKWDLLFSCNNLVKIGCKIKSIEEWEKWFAGTEEFDTKRDTEDFRKIQLCFELGLKTL